MGYASYSEESHRAATTARSRQSDREVFTQVTGCHAAMDPKGLKFRESRDSAAHPASLAIVFALDETGSMGGIPKSLAKSELPTFMSEIMNYGVADPQVLFMGVGDATTGEMAPLQVGQFESSDQAMDTWLTAINLVGNGGGNGSESYELAAYTIARHTVTDCFDKRGKKGYVFFTGDDAAYPVVSAEKVRALIGDDLREDIRTDDIFRELGERYHVFFLIPNGHRNRTEAGWRRILGDHVIALEGDHDTCQVAAVLVALTEGKVTLAQLTSRLTESGMDRRAVGTIVTAVTPYAELLGRSLEPQPRLETAVPHPVASLH